MMMMIICFVFYPTDHPIATAAIRPCQLCPVVPIHPFFGGGGGVVGGVRTQGSAHPPQPSPFCPFPLPKAPGPFLGAALLCILYSPLWMLGRGRGVQQNWGGDFFRQPARGKGPHPSLLSCSLPHCMRPPLTLGCTNLRPTDAAWGWDPNPNPGQTPDPKPPTPNVSAPTPKSQTCHPKIPKLPSETLHPPNPKPPTKNPKPPTPKSQSSHPKPRTPKSQTPHPQSHICPTPPTPKPKTSQPNPNLLPPNAKPRTPNPKYPSQIPNIPPKTSYPKSQSSHP